MCRLARMHSLFLLSLMAVVLGTTCALPTSADDHSDTLQQSRTTHKLRDKWSLGVQKRSSGEEDEEGDDEGDGGGLLGGGPRITFQPDMTPPARLLAPLYSLAVLECQAGGTPPPTIHWLKNGERVRQSREDNAIVDEVMERESGPGVAAPGPGGDTLGLASTTSRLYIDCVTADDTATYTCVAENQYRRVATNTKLRVAPQPDPNESVGSHCKVAKRTGGGPRLSPARIYMWTSSYLELQDNSVVLFCRATGHPRPEIRWRDPMGEEIKSGRGHYQILPTGDLRVRAITFFEHMGDFTCVAKNTLGADETGSFLYPTINK